MFLGWLDRSSSAPNKFLKISTSNSGLITLSGSHVIFRRSNSGALESVYASQLVVGDKLVRKKEEVLVEEEVVAVEEVFDSGFWAPLTEEGTLLVDGFLASCYASFPHEASQVRFHSSERWLETKSTGCPCPCQEVPGNLA